MIAQTLLSGLTAGAIYALVALGFAIIYNASHVINFAQGEFVMIGGMAAASLVETGLPLPLSILLSVGIAVLVGLVLEKLAIEPARGASVVTLIIITIGASILLRGLAALVWDKKIHPLPAFSGDAPIAIGTATLLPQTLWVLGTTVVVVALLWWFFNRTLTGKAILAVSVNRLAAELMGISVRRVLAVSFGLSAALGALAGILIAPISFTSWDVGVMLGLKGFAAAILGGLGSGPGAIAGGLALGLIEALGAGYLSSAYKDVFAFVLLLSALVFLPNGLAGRRVAERV
ncbi:MAG TPA: branched-chain amino acid ABC transporter permease [Burkholderiales bacterium]|nr:branched-chain amino acid ABC transporter permease [Burkholderiales bacterium]